MIVSDHQPFADAEAATLANARALAGRICPDIFSEAGLLWLVGIIKAMPERDSEHVEVLDPEQQRELLRPWARAKEPALVIAVVRVSPRRGVLAIRTAAVGALDDGMLYVDASREAARWAAAQASRAVAAAAYRTAKADSVTPAAAPSAAPVNDIDGAFEAMIDCA